MPFLGSLCACSQLSVHGTSCPTSHQCDVALQWCMTVFFDIQQSVVKAMYGVWELALYTLSDHCTFSSSRLSWFFDMASCSLLLYMPSGQQANILYHWQWLHINCNHFCSQLCDFLTPSLTALLPATGWGSPCLPFRWLSIAPVLPLKLNSTSRSLHFTTFSFNLKELADWTLLLSLPCLTLRHFPNC